MIVRFKTDLTTYTSSIEEATMADQSIKRTKSEKVVSAMVAIVMAVGTYLAAQYMMSPSPEQKEAEVAAALQEIAKSENPTAPKVMENGLVLQSVKAIGQDITYTYTVPTTLERDVRFGGTLRDELLQKALCSGPARAVIQAGANFHYIYLSSVKTEELSKSTVYFCI
jgi:hypothetical protein